LFITVFVSLVILICFVISPLLLLGSARLSGLHYITFKKALSTVLLILSGYIGIIIILSLPVLVIGIGHPLLDLLIGLGIIIISLWIIMRRFEIGILRTIGVYVLFLVFSVALSLFVKTFAVQAYKIPASSMEPTLLVGDRILVNKFIYGMQIPLIRKILFPVSDPERNDLVVFVYPGDEKKDFIKRIIGLPGEKVEIIDSKLHVNDRIFDDTYGVYRKQPKKTKEPDMPDHFGPVVVPANQFFVLGDNRDHSYDSRYWGFVGREAIKGKAFRIYWSWDSEANLVRRGRIGLRLN